MARLIALILVIGILGLISFTSPFVSPDPEAQNPEEQDKGLISPSDTPETPGPPEENVKIEDSLRSDITVDLALWDSSLKGDINARADVRKLYIEAKFYEDHSDTICGHNNAIIPALNSGETYDFEINYGFTDCNNSRKVNVLVQEM